MHVILCQLKKAFFYYTYYDILFWNKTQNNLFSSFLSFPWPQVLTLALRSSTWLDPPACRCCTKKRKRNLKRSKSNNTRCSISVFLRYASFQVLHSLCEIDSQCVENLRPCWHCCADTCCGLWCPWTPEVLPPPLLLTEPISTSCSFVSVCLCSKALISHIQFRDSFVASTMKCQCPESFSTPFRNC